GCMCNRRHVLNRIEQPRNQGDPLTNYGNVIAYINKIIDKVVYPE
ncbi:MAG: [FeFe] hydrogenase H-cluster maturation GTPase HydF, partial [Rikenellaceae bacterium]|nr:[FeFe] hydrogenase H-cluster maturation GTPase HydF [Rikenellaceae bacterium]